MKKQTLFWLCAFILLLISSYVLLEKGAFWLVYRMGQYLSVLDREYYTKIMMEDPPWRFRKIPYTFDSKIGMMQTPSNMGLWRGASYPQAEFRNLIIINSAGLRSSKDYDSPSALRVAVLGDSFVQAFQVAEKDSFVKVAERSLRNNGLPVDVLNYGRCSTGTVHQVGLLDEVMARFHPNVVVLAWFPNDFVDNSPSYPHEHASLIPQYALTDAGDVRMEPFDLHRTGMVDKTARLELKKTRWHWRLLSWVTGRLDQARFSLFLRFLSEFIKDKWLPKSDYDLIFDIYKKDYGPALKESLHVTAVLIGQMNQRCRREGVKFFVMLIPALEQVRPELLQQYIRARGGVLSESDFDAAAPQRNLIKELDYRRIPFVDLMFYYQLRGKKEMLYYPKDLHFNGKGHRLAGQILAEQLRPCLENMIRR